MFVMLELSVVIVWLSLVTKNTSFIQKKNSYFGSTQLISLLKNG